MRTIYLLIMAALFLGGCGSGGGDSSGNGRAVDNGPSGENIVKDVTPAEASALLQENAENPALVLLDIRTAEEYANEHIEGAVNPVDFYSPSFRDELDRLNKNQTYLIYCRTGRRSGLAKAVMEELGFTRVYNLLGGITAWKEAGYPTSNN